MTRTRMRAGARRIAERDLGAIVNNDCQNILVKLRADLAEHRGRQGAFERDYESRVAAEWGIREGDDLIGGRRHDPPSAPCP